MTYRGRAFAIAATLLVIAAFVLNVAFGTPPPSDAQTQAASSKAAGPPPVAPVYVPRPAALLAGRGLDADVSALEVASAFVTAYFTYDTTKQTMATYLDGLPHVSQEYKPTLATLIEPQWQADASRHLTSRMLDAPHAEVNATDAGSSTVQVRLTRQITQSAAPQKDEHPTGVVTLKRIDGGWKVAGLRIS